MPIFREGVTNIRTDRIPVKGISIRHRMIINNTITFLFRFTMDSGEGYLKKKGGDISCNTIGEQQRKTGKSASCP
jgi:hypothetical protein